MSRGEHAWIRSLLGRLAQAPADPRVLVGPGDDAAVLRAGRGSLLITTDALVEGVHFRQGWLGPGALGRRAFAINASDVAAMGGRPTAAVMALTAPRGVADRTLDGIVDGFARAARASGASLVGGNVTGGAQLAITVTLLGDVPGRPVTRAGARPGDGVWVTGRIGATGMAVRRLRDRHRARLPAVPDRVAAAGLLATVASAMIDVSDGLVQDLEHVCRASRVGAHLMAGAIPIAPSCRALGPGAVSFAITAGEDYELVVVVPRRREAMLRRLLPRLGCAFTQVGTIVAGVPAVHVHDGRGGMLALATRGFDHRR